METLFSVLFLLLQIVLLVGMWPIAKGIGRIVELLTEILAEIRARK